MSKVISLREVLSGCLVQVIMISGFLVLLATGLSFILSPLYRYFELETSFDLALDAMSIVAGALVLFIPLMVINEFLPSFLRLSHKFTWRFIFLVTLTAGLLGVFASVFFWENTAGKSFTYLTEGGRSLYERINHLFAYLFFLGFGLLVFSWDYGRKFILGSVLSASIWLISYNLFLEKYYYVLLGIYGLLSFYFILNQLGTGWFLFFTSFIPFNILKFLQYGTITWHFGLRGNPKKGNNFEITELEPEDYIKLTDNPETFYSIITQMSIGHLILFSFFIYLYFNSVFNQKNSRKFIEEKIHFSFFKKTSMSRMD